MSYIQKLIDAQNDIIIICNENFELKYLNKIFYKFFKTERVDEILKLLKTQEFNKNIKIKIKNYKSNKYTFLLKLTKIDSDISITLKDITKTSAYEKSLLQSNINFVEYKNIVDRFLIVSKTDTEGIITYVNNSFVKISGYSKEELIGEHHNIVKHPDMPQHIFNKMWKTIKKGEIWQGIMRNLKKNGEEYYVKTIVAPLFNSKNKIKEFIAFRIDISDFINAKEKAQKAKEIKEMFLANMSHEIRTPLTGILGFLQVLQQKELSKDSKKIVDIILNSADTLLSVVNDVLDLSKIETQGVVIHKTRFNPMTSFKNTVKLFKASALEKNIEYIYHIKTDNCIISDEHRLKQVLSNLIGNAIKFTPENGKVIIYIETKRKYDNKIEIEFCVQDSGIGISQEKLKKLFRPFSQVEGIEETYGGSGLGLFISSQIISKLGGKLEVETKEEEGSKFYFSLEFEKCELLKKEKTNQINVRGKILIAEDNKVNQALLKVILKTKGNLDIVLVENGEDAVNKFKNEKFDLVFMDIFVPIMKGIEATELILEYEKLNYLEHTPIVALTANALDGDKEKFLAQGFDDYISKPIEHTKLDEVLLKYLKEENLVSNIAHSMNLDEEIIKELLGLYFENIDGDLLQLSENINDEDFNEIRMVAHKIAGASGAVQLDKVYRTAKEIENLARKMEDVNYKQMFNILVSEIEEYKQTLKITDL